MSSLMCFYAWFHLFEHFCVSFFSPGPVISSATQVLSSFYINCPELQGDFVRLHWLPPDAKKQRNMTLLYYFDRWRGLKLPSVKGKRLQLAGPPYNAEAGSFSFVLKPELRDGGLYICDVYLNDSVFSQGTLLTVLKGTDREKELRSH